MVECTSPLTRQSARIRGFESLTLRTPATGSRSRVGHESDREPIFNISSLSLLITYRRHEAMEEAEEPIYSALISVYRGLVGLGVAVGDYMQVPW